MINSVLVVVIEIAMVVIARGINHSEFVVKAKVRGKEKRKTLVCGKS